MCLLIGVLILLVLIALLKRIYAVQLVWFSLVYIITAATTTTIAAVFPTLSYPEL